MGTYKVGQVIKLTRKSLGITQEELCDGICSVETLSKIENGKRKPNRANFQVLMERMGKSGEKYLPFIHDEDIHVMIQARKINTMLARRRFHEADIFLEELKDKIDVEDMVNLQFVLETKTFIEFGLGEITAERKRKQLECALQCTVRDYREGILPKRIFSKTEVTILCNIASSYSEEGNQDRAICMLRQLESYLKKIQNQTEDWILDKVLVLANLGRCLGIRGDTQEAIRIEEKALKLSIEEGTGNILDFLLYNIAFEKEIMFGYNKESKELLLQAYFVAEFHHNYIMMKHIREHLIEKYENWSYVKI